MNGLTYTKVGDYYLPNSGIKRAAGHANRQVWAHEAPLSERTPERAVYQPAPDGKTLSPFVGD